MDVRDVTNDEVDFYHHNGWVKMDGLISAELAGGFLEAAKRIMSRVPVSDVHPETVKLGEPVHTREYFFVHKVLTDPFRSFVFSPEAGRGGQRLINRDRLTHESVPVRYCESALACTFPVPPSRRADEVDPYIAFHQDLFADMDRVGTFNMWIALDEVTPEQGALRFLSGSHREGPLGSRQDPRPLMERYPKLRDLYEVSPPLHYKPGDATAHHCNIVHEAPANRGTRDRWAYLPTFMPGDCVVQNDRRLGLPDTNDPFPIIETGAAV